jgi:hypothetical protein
MAATQHHYVLGHVALRQICQSDPVGFFGIMASPHRENFLADVWRQIRNDCDAGGEPSFSIQDLGVTPCRVKDFPCLLLTMPPPKNVPEAIFVGIVLKVDMTQAQPPAGEIPEVLYATLEKGIHLGDGSERTVLCAWRANLHVNYGDGPPADRTAFLAAVEKLIT